MKNGKSKNILLGVCGSIAAYKVCELIRSLRALDFEARCIMTEAAQKFITPLTLQTLSGQRVYTDLFDETCYDPEHIALAEYAGLLVIVPATADVIARLAGGFANDLLTSTILSTKAKVLVCPAMHSNMWLNQATRDNVSRLQKLGYLFLGPDSGKLVSHQGVGRLVPVQDIVNKIVELTGK